MFLNCDKCSKHDCLSCPRGKTGPTCEKDELLQSDNKNITEKLKKTEVRNSAESAFSYNSTTAYGFDKSMPEIAEFDASKPKNSSFQQATDGNGAEIKLDVIEFKTGKSIVGLFSENTPYVFLNSSTNINETVHDMPMCTTNCSNSTENQGLVRTSESVIDVRSNNKTEFENEIDAGYSLNDKNKTVFLEGDEFLTFGEPSPIELSPANDSVNASDANPKEEFQNTENELVMHRSPNPSIEEDNSKILRHILKKMNEQELDIYQQHDIADNQQKDLPNANQQQNFADPQQEHAELPSVFIDEVTVKELQNKIGLQNVDYQPQSNSRTTAETKYVYLGANAENESKYPDTEYESSSVEQEKKADEELKEKETIKPFQKHNFSEPHQLKQSFDNKEEANSKSKSQKYGLWKNLCKFFPNISVCRQPEDDSIQPRNDPQSQMEEESGNLQSPDFSDAENNAPIADFLSEPAVDTIELNNNEYSKVPKNDLVHFEKEQPISSLEAIEKNNDEYSVVLKNGFLGLEKEQPRTKARLHMIQQQNDQYFENYGKTHEPIAKNLVFNDHQRNPSQSYYLGQRHAEDSLPFFANPKRNIISENANSKNEDVILQKTIFESLLRLIEPHITSFIEDKSPSKENRVHGSSNVRPESHKGMRMQPFLKSFPLSPVKDFKVDDLQKLNRDYLLKSFNGKPNAFFSVERQKPSVVKGQILIASIAQENGTAPRVVPGSILTRNFEFEIPMLFPSLYSDLKDSETSKTERPKHHKGSRRFRKLHNKRRRNGVKNNSAKCDSQVEDCSKDHTQNKKKQNQSSRFGREDEEGNVRIKYIKIENEPMYDSVEMPESAKLSVSKDSSSYAESDVQPQDLALDNVNYNGEDKFAQSNPGIGFNNIY